MVMGFIFLLIRKKLFQFYIVNDKKKTVYTKIFLHFTYFDQLLQVYCFKTYIKNVIELVIFSLIAILLTSAVIIRKNFF